MERLAPAVLLVLFDGVPAVVHIEEPRQGIQFGVRLDPDGSASAAQGARSRCATTTTGDPVPPEDAFTGTNSVDVPFRPKRARRDQRRRSCASGSPPRRRTPAASLEPNEYALQMLRFPYRQVFGDPDNLEGQRFYDLDRFKVSVALSTWKATVRKQRHQGACHEQIASRLDPDTIREVTRRASASSPPIARQLDVAEIATWDPVPAARASPARADRRAGAVRRSPEAPRRWCACRCSSPAPNGKWSSRSRRRHARSIRREGTPRPAGVHLHWAMPDALLRGTLDAARRRRQQPSRHCRCCPIAGSCCASLLPKGGDRGRRHGLGARSRPRRRRSAGVVDRRRRGLEAARRRRARHWAGDELTGTVGGVGELVGRLRRGAEPLRLPRSARRHRRGRAAGRRPRLRVVPRRRLVERCRARSARQGAQQRQPARIARAAALAPARRMGRRAVGAASRTRRSSSFARRSG